MKKNKMCSNEARLRLYHRQRFAISHVCYAEDGVHNSFCVCMISNVSCCFVESYRLRDTRPIWPTCCGGGDSGGGDGGGRRLQQTIYKLSIRINELPVQCSKALFRFVSIHIESMLYAVLTLPVGHAWSIYE